MKRVSLAIRFASESKPTLAMPRKRRPFASPTSISRVDPDSSRSIAAAGLVGDAEDAGEVVSAPARHDAERNPSPGERPADHPHQPVSAHHHRDLAGVAGRDRLRDRVLGVAGPLDAECGPALVELRLDRRQALERAAARRGGIDEERQRAIGEAGFHEGQTSRARQVGPPSRAALPAARRSRCRAPPHRP